MREELFFIRAIVEMVAADLKPLKVHAKSAGGTFISHTSMNWDLKLYDTLDAQGVSIEPWRKSEQTFRFWHRTATIDGKITQNATIMIQHPHTSRANLRVGQRQQALALQNKINICLPVEDFAHEATHLWFVATCLNWCHFGKMIEEAIIQDPFEVIKERESFLQDPKIWQHWRTERRIRERCRQNRGTNP